MISQIIQPFRYRGYVYDVETGLYYLRSRYYNPEWGRFINADVLIKGNLFCYCYNNPIMLTDEGGKNPYENHSLMPASYVVNQVRIMYEEEWIYVSGKKDKGYVDCIGVILYCVKSYFGGWVTKKGDDQYKIKINNKMITIGQGTNSAITYNIVGHETQLKKNIIPNSDADIESTLLPGMVLYSSDLGHVGVYIGYYYDEKNKKAYSHAVIHSFSEGKPVMIEEVKDSSFVYYAEYNYMDYDMTYADTTP